MYRRIAISACVVALLGACTAHSSYPRHRAEIYYRSPAHQPAPQSSCAYNPDSCMYDGPYEPGERAFAEEEAKRLNRASLQRLRRSR